MASERANKNQRAPRGEDVSDLQAERRQAGRDHTAWIRDVVRWRAEYQQAPVELARRIAVELKLDDYEDALAKHEAAIAAHEEILERHERLLAAGGEGQSDIAGEFQALHRQLETRHERSRQEHEHLRKIHTALLEALAMLAAAD